MTVEFPASALLAPALAIFAGALFGLVVHVQRRGLDNADPLAGAFLSVLSMAGFFWILSPAFIELHWFASHAVLIFALGGLFFPAAAQTFQIYSIRRAGPAMTATVGSFTPFFAVIPAVLFLGEAFGLQLAAGMALMTVGLILTALPTRRIPRSWPLWAIFLPLGSALVRGLAQPITKTGLNEIPSAFLATLVFGSVSSLVLALLIVATGRVGRVRQAGAGMKWFALSGVMNGCGILCLNTAIGIGSVTVAAPLASMSPLWTLMFGLTIFRNEKLTPRHFVVALLVVGGALLIITR